MLRRNVLIFQAGGLGDFVLTWPLAVALGRIYPQSRIFYITQKQKGELAKRVLRLEASDVDNGWHALFADEGELSPSLLSLLQSSHAIYTFLPITTTWHQNVKRLNADARCVEVSAQLIENYSGHITQRMVDSLPEPERSALQQMLRSIADRGIGYRPARGETIVLHPGSGSAAKRWPLDLYLELAANLRQRGKTVRFIIGEVEREKFTMTDLQKLGATGYLHNCDTNLDLLREISTAALLIGNDSGPAHLAGIVGIPTIALFGPTNPINWQPLGPTVRVLQHQNLSQLSVSDVVAAIDLLMSTAPFTKERNEIAADD